MMNILYVDEDAPLAGSVKAYLEDTGHFQVDLAVSIGEALEKARPYRYDAIISGYKVPGMDGVRLLKVLRASGDSTPFVLFSGMGGEVAVEAFLDGADFCLRKGDNPRLLIAVLDRIVREVVRRREESRQQQENEERYQTLVEHVPDIIVVHSGGIIRYINPAVTRSLGYLPAEVRNRPLMEFIPPEYHALVADAVRRRMEGREINPYEVEVMGRAGNRRMFIVTGSRIEYMGVPGSLNILTDITEKKQAEKALIWSEERFREIFDKANDAIELIALDADGRPRQFIDLNEIACRMVQYTREELLHMSPFAINTDYYSRPLDEIIRELHTAGHTTFETGHRRKDGSTFPVEINTHIITLQGEKVLLSVIRDISRRKQAETALRQSNRKIKLLSGITRHDIRNLLLALDGYLALLHEEVRDPRLMDHVTRSMQISARISTMIEFTKLVDEIGIQAPSFENLRALVDAAAGGISPGPVRFINEIPADVEIRADSLMVKVFFNLIDNAIRHGAHLTTVRFWSEEREGGYTILCEDDGIGIPMTLKEQVFECGFGKYSGLGLFISREILLINGITVRETGEPGRGARFEMRVPKGVYRVVASGDRPE